MKKFFRVALVCALAGATLLYTGCTKDYSEDLSSLQKKVEDQGKSITSLEDQVAALLRAKTELENADTQAQTAIDSLKSRVSALEKEVDTLKSERTRLENLINKNAGDITKLQDSLKQVDSLIGVIQGQISGINGKIDTIEATIKTHKDSLAALDTELKTMAKKAYVDSEIERVMTEVAKKANSADVDSLVAKLREEIATKADKATVDSLVDDIKAKLADRYTKAEVDSLINDLKTTLQAAIDLKADKTYVDTELAKKADQSWVENQLKLYVTVEEFNNTVATLTGAIQAAMTEIKAVKTSLNDLYDFLGLIRNSETGVITAEADGLIATMQSKIDSLGNELTNTKTELAGVKATAEAAKEEADAAVAFIGDLNKDGMTLAQYLANTYYTKSEIDVFLAAIDQHIKDTLAYYLPLAKYVEDSAEIRKSINAIDTAIFDVIKSVNTKLLANDPSAPTFDDKKIENLAAAITALMDTKVDTMTFNEFVRATEARLNQLEEDMGKVLKRVQSLVYVPDYDDNRITLNWAQMSAQNNFDTRDLPAPYDVNGLPASFDTAKWNAFFKVLNQKSALGLPIPTDDEFMALIADLMQSFVQFAGNLYGYGYDKGALEKVSEDVLSEGGRPIELISEDYEGYGMYKSPIGPRDFQELFMVSPNEAVWRLIMMAARYTSRPKELSVAAPLPGYGNADLGGIQFVGNGLGFETPIVEPSHIKYRVYGVDAAATAQALAENYEDVFDFDVVRVKTRANSDEVKMRITDAVADGDVIDFTVVPEGIPNRFWLYTWDIKNYSNPKLHAVYLRDALLQAFGTGKVNIEVLAYLLQQWAENGGLDAATFMNIYAREMRRAADDQAAVVDDVEGEIEVNSDFPSFSISLVLSQADSSRFITSGYNNVVPAAVSDKIDLEIMRDNEPISWTVADEEEIVYSDPEEHTVLAGTSLAFVKNGEKMEGEELAAFLDAAGIKESDIVVRFTSSVEHLSPRARALRNSADGFPAPKATYKNVYFNNVADDAAPAAKVNLTKSCQEGVGSEEYVMINYFVGPAYVQAAALVTVVPDHLDIEVNLEDIVWSYDKVWNDFSNDFVPGTDAQIDSAYYFAGADSLYFRDSLAATIVNETEVMTQLAAKDVEYPKDFKGATPDTASSSFTFKFAEGAAQTLTLHELVENVTANPETAFNVYPFFKDGKLMAHVYNFPFFKPAAGYDIKTAKGNVNPLTEISYSLKYYLCDSSFVANITGKIKVDDRDRAPITIALPTTKEDFYVNFSTEVSDSLYTGDALSEGVTVTSSFADHHIAKADVTDAFGKVYSKTWTGLNTGSYADGNGTQVRDVLYGYQVPSQQNPSAAVANVPVNYKWVAGMGSNLEGGWAYLQNERIDFMTTTTRPITTGAPAVPATALVRNNTTAHINTEFVADAEKGVNFNTICNFNSRDLRDVEITPVVDYKFYLTLWYGQDVEVTKSYDINVDGIFDYERINAYVQTDDQGAHYFTTVQPKWSPKEATTDFTVPVQSYETSQVLLNQHFRIVDVKADEGKGVAVTDNAGEILAEYNYLRRRFWLEETNGGAFVNRIDDPRGLTEDWAANWRVSIFNPIDSNTGPNGEPNIVNHRSSADTTNVYGDLYVVNNNGSFVKLTTRFDRAAANLIYASDKTASESYENYFIKLYDPLGPLNIDENVPTRVNINNSMDKQISIYKFLTMKDKRGKEVIDHEHNGWVVGDGENGFANGVAVNSQSVYDLHYTHDIVFPEDLEPETRARFNFNVQTGILTYDNTLETSLTIEIPVVLTINVEYPWGHRDKTITITIFNSGDPVDENPAPADGE